MCILHKHRHITTIEYTDIRAGSLLEALNIKTPICTRIPISKDRLAAFTNYCSSITKDQALEETVLTLFHSEVHGCFQLVGVTTHINIH